MTRKTDCVNYCKDVNACYYGRCDNCQSYRSTFNRTLMINCDKCGREFDRYIEEYEIYDGFEGKVYYCKSCDEKLKKIFKVIENSDLTLLEEE